MLGGRGAERALRPVSPRIRTFFEELGRRRVVRVAVMYAGAVFVALEAADIIFPALGLPDSAVRILVLVSLLGFPVALVVAWVFDLTPKGVIMTQPRMGSEPGADSSVAGVWTRAVLLALTFVAVGWASWMATRWSPVSGEPALDRRSIAVLPFQDMNRTEETAFFTAGIHEDILSHLSRIQDLRVISRTSVMQYENTSKPLRDIARELGVGSILEGSVRQADGRVRVVTQLIDARNDDHIWAQTFDRDKQDIFQVQSEIAQQIAQALEAELSPEVEGRLAEAPTANLDAYDLYLRGRLHWDRRENRGDATRAVELFGRAVELDPGFAESWAALSRARMWLFWSWPGYADQPVPAAEALDRAVSLDPDAADVRLAEGFFRFYGQGDYGEALQYFRSAAELRPSDAEAHEAIGLIQRREGRWEEAAARLEQALQLDPRSYSLSFALAQTYRRMRRFAEAERYYDRAISIAPDLPAAYRERLVSRVTAAGDTVGARRLLEESRGTLDPDLYGELESILAFYRGDLESALRLRREHRPQDHEALGTLHLLLGHREEAAQFGDSLLARMQPPRSGPSRNPGFVQTRVVAETHARMGMAYVLRGDHTLAIKEGTRAAALLPISADAFAGAEHVRTLGVILALLGEHAGAMDQLEEILVIPSTITLEELRLSPLFEHLRDQPRTQRLLAEGHPSPAA